eukprot:1300756-Ditylum_brightwellii.AAC.1
MAGRLVNDGKDFLLWYYFDELQTYLVKFGAVETAEGAPKHFNCKKRQRQVWSSGGAWRWVRAVPCQMKLCVFDALNTRSDGV